MQNLILGSHIAVSRGFYTHHGIYIGGDKVVHYSGFAQAFKKGAVQETSIVDFLGDEDKFKIINYPQSQAVYDPSEVATRAINRIGEDDYNVIFNNCEHFACWCVTGNYRCDQVNSVMRQTSSALLYHNLIRSKTAQETIGRALISTTTSATQKALIGGMIGGSAVTTTSIIGAGAVTAGLVAAAPVAVPVIAIGALVGGFFSLFD